MKPIRDALTTRLRAQVVPPCGDLGDDHNWTKYGTAVPEPTVLFVLCSICGRDPLELLSAMIVQIPHG